MQSYPHPLAPFLNESISVSTQSALVSLFPVTLKRKVSHTDTTLPPQYENPITYNRGFRFLNCLCFLDLYVKLCPFEGLYSELHVAYR